MNNTENNDVSGIVLLIAGAVVLSVVSFVLTHLGTILLVLLAVAVLCLLGVLLRALARSLTERATAGRRSAPRTTARTVERTAEQARRTAAEDMRTAWLRWQLRPVPDQAEQRDVSLIPRTLAVVPQADWDVDRLRQHGRSVWALRAGARRHDQLPEVDARLDRVAAMISDLTDDEFDTGLGQTSDRYLFHRERGVRLAYLEGGGRGVEVIMDTVTATRAQIRQDAATRAAAESLVQQRNAALRALRETHRPTETRDAHAAWEAKAEEIDE